MSLQEIEVHFEKMQSIAGNLMQLAERTAKLADGQGADMGMSVRSMWVSENAYVFERRAQNCLREVKKAAEEMKILSEDVKKKAEQIYQAEKWNMLTAKARSYR